MNKIELIKIINEVVDYKLKKLIPQLEKKIRQEIQEQVLNDEPEKSKLGDLLKSQATIEDTAPVEEYVRPARKVKEIQFSKDPVLNKILNDTIRTPKSDVTPPSLLREMTGTDEQMQDVPTMSVESLMAGDGLRLTPIKVPSSDPNGIPRIPSRQPNPMAQEMLKQQITADSGGNEELADIMVKDYRQVLKKAAEKAKKHRGG